MLINAAISGIVAAFCLWLWHKLALFSGDYLWRWSSEKIAAANHQTHGFEIARPILSEDGLLSLTSPSKQIMTRATVLFWLARLLYCTGIFPPTPLVDLWHRILPMLLVAVGRLYLTSIADGRHRGFLVGLSICAISRIAFSRFNRRAIVADASFLMALNGTDRLAVIWHCTMIDPCIRSKPGAISVAIECANAHCRPRSVPASTVSLITKGH